MERNLKMSELKEAVKRGLKVSGHSLAHLTSGVREIAVIDKRIQKETLTKYLKGGWILEGDFDENYDMIAEWRNTRGIINEARKAIRELKESTANMGEQIANVESEKVIDGFKWGFFRPMLPTYRGNLERWQKDLVREQRRFDRVKPKFKPLKVAVKSLKDKFKLYISQLEAEK